MPRRISPAVRVASRLFGKLEPATPVLLTGVSWNDYRWLDRKRDSSGSRAKIAYHRGKLELMTTSFQHDSVSRRLDNLVKLYCLVHGIQLRGAGGMTVDREEVDAAIEPDESFYIQSLPLVARETDLDFSIHPPPDLAIEVDRSRSSLPKQPIYADLGIPELWRHANSEVTFFVRTRSGTYRRTATSRAMPPVTSADVTRLVFGNAGDDSAFLADVMLWANRLKSPTN